MMLGNFGVLLMAPLLSASSFMGFGGNDGYAYANANVSNDWRDAVSEWREASFNSNNNWSWGDRDEDEDPVIRRIAPEEGAAGTEVTVRGSRFTDDSIVYLDDEAIEDATVSNNGRVLRFTIPDDATAGDYEISIANDDRTSNAVQFTVTEEDDQTGELAIDSVDGPTSLAEGEEGTWTVNVSGADSDLRYSVKWGDEGGFRSLMSAFDDGQASATFTHTYEEPGTYTPEFTVRDENGNEVSKSAAEVTVGDNGSVHIESIDPASAEAGDRVTLSGTGFDGDTKVWIGRREASGVEVENDSKLTFLVPSIREGDYRVRVVSDEGQSNVVGLEVKAESETQLSVSGVDAPTRLEVNEEGTWTVHASSNTEGNLRYSVDWGEDNMMLRSADSEWTQSSATFTHSYAEPGTYHPKFTVTDEEGNSSSVSASVVVR